jgi:hypothetical protein
MASFDGGNGLDSVTLYCNGSSFGMTVNATSVASGSMSTTFTAALERVIGIGSAASESFTVNGSSTTPKLSFESGGGTDSLTVSAGLITLEADVLGSKGGSVSASVATGSTLTLASSQHFAQMTVNGTVRVAAGGDKLLRVTGLTVATAGRLDLTDNDMIVDYGATASSPLGSWTGTSYNGVAGELARNAILSSSAAGHTRLGISEARDVLALAAGGSATWSGEVVDATAVLVKYTYDGDANLDGVVSGDDYSAIDFNILIRARRGGSTATSTTTGSSPATTTVRLTSIFSPKARRSDAHWCWRRLCHQG